LRIGKINFLPCLGFSQRDSLGKKPWQKMTEQRLEFYPFYEFSKIEIEHEEICYHGIMDENFIFLLQFFKNLLSFNLLIYFELQGFISENLFTISWWRCR